VCLPLLISPCTIKSRSSLLALAHPDGHKTVVVWYICLIHDMSLDIFTVTALCKKWCRVLILCNHSLHTTRNLAKRSHTSNCHTCHEPFTQQTSMPASSNLKHDKNQTCMRADEACLLQPIKYNDCQHFPAHAHSLAVVYDFYCIW